MVGFRRTPSNRAKRRPEKLLSLNTEKTEVGRHGVRLPLRDSVPHSSRGPLRAVRYAHCRFATFPPKRLAFRRRMCSASQTPRPHAPVKSTKRFLCARLAPPVRLRIAKRNDAQIPLKSPSFAPNFVLLPQGAASPLAQRGLRGFVFSRDFTTAGHSSNRHFLPNCTRKDVRDNLGAKRRECKTLLAKVVKRRTNMNQR